MKTGGGRGFPPQQSRDAPLLAAALVVLGVVCATALASSGTTPPGPTWNLATFAANDGGIAAIACPSPHLCIAADDLGSLWTTSDPTGPSSAWRKLHVDGGDAFSWVSCPSIRLCVAADDNGNVLTSNHPTGGGSAWHRADIDGSQGLVEVSCPTASACFIGDADGRLLWSDDPAGGRVAWHITVIKRGFGLTALSCPSASRCVAGDDSGDAAVSTDPRGGQRTWHVAGIDGYNALAGVSCPSLSLCVAVDAEAYSQGSSGQILTSTQPLGGGRSWRRTFTDQGSNFGSVTCSSAKLCVAEDAGGELFASTDPTRTRSWLASNSFGSAGEISCVGRSLCATGAANGVLTTTNPAG